MESSNMSTGSLRTKISLKNGNTPQITLPFYGMKPKLPPSSQVLGSDDLIARFDLSSAFARFCGPKKPKEDLASFLGGICGISNLNMNISDPSCSLRNLVDKPPITGREIMNLSSSVMSGFKLAADPYSAQHGLDQYRESFPMDASVLNGQGTNTADKTAASTSETDPTKQKRLKRSLEDFEVPEFDKKAKKHRGEDKSERKQKKKKKKKEKERDGKRTKDKEARDLPFY